MVSNESAMQADLSLFHTLLYAASFVEAATAIVGNALVVCAVLLCETLRHKEMAPLLILACADGLVCLTRAYVIGLGDYRPQLAVELTWRQYTARQCFGAADVANFAVTQAQCAAMLLLSVDRFIAIAFFNTYILLGRRYTYAVTAVVVGYAGSVSTAAVLANRYMTVPDETTWAFNCLAVAKFPLWFQATRVAVQLLLVCGSVLVYGVVIVVNGRKKLSDAEGLRQVQLKRQKRLARTLSLVTAGSVVFFCLPYTVMALSKWFMPKLSRAQVMVPMNFAALANTSVNPLIYFCRLPDMRKAMISLMRCENPNKAHAQVVALPMQQPGNRRNEAAEPNQVSPT